MMEMACNLDFAGPCIGMVKCDLCMELRHCHQVGHILVPACRRCYEFHLKELYKKNHGPNPTCGCIL